MRKLLRIAILEPHSDHLYIAGNIRDFNVNKEHLYAADRNSKVTEIIPIRAEAMDTAADGEKNAHKGYFFEVSLPLCVGASYSFFCRRGSEKAELSLRFGKFSRLSDIEGCFFKYNGLIVCRKDESIKVIADKIINRIPLERKYKKALSGSMSDDLISLRQEAVRLKGSGRPVWLVSDRSDCAEDNGMALFEYLMQSEETASVRSTHDIRFVISSSSPDFEKMEKIGPVVDAASNLHKALFIASEFVISSAADEWIRNPLGTDLKFFRDLAESRFIFLQHGIIKDDLSGWLHKLKKNFNIFITSAPDEWHSICDGAYGYDESVVKLTGLARYDKLKNEPKKKIAILPTWRKYAAPDLLPGTSERPYSDSFKDTDYFEFYNRLINDPRLLRVMNDTGYTGTFYMHPSHMKQWKDFQENETITVWKDLVPFSRVFSENSLLITDYSSVAIDFAYLGKPVVYAQFDKEAFTSGHSYVPGYYEYERDGFGPVCYDYESAVEEIINILSNDCREEGKYLDRVNSFFAFRDKNNCRRILDEILKL